jgi:hypothetical protein
MEVLCLATWLLRFIHIEVDVAIQVGVPCGYPLSGNIEFLHQKLGPSAVNYC